MKSKRIPRVIRINPLKICTKFYGFSPTVVEIFHSVPKWWTDLLTEFQPSLKHTTKYATVKQMPCPKNAPLILRLHTQRKAQSSGGELITHGQVVPCSQKTPPCLSSPHPSIHPAKRTSISLCRHHVTELMLGEEAPVKIGSLSRPGHPLLFPSSIRRAATWTTADPHYNLIGQQAREDTQE